MGTIILLSRDVAAGVAVLSGGLEVVSSGGVASATAVGPAGEQDVFAGGLASGTILSGGEQVVFAGGTASGTAVDAGGTLIAAAAGAIAAGASVGSGGVAYVSSGGTASDLTVLAGGTAYVDDGAALTGALTDDGALVGTETGTLSIAAVISGAGAVTQAGSGTLVLGGTGGGNAYTGGSTLSAGTLELAARNAAGTGAIRFASGAAATLRLDTAILPTNTITGFAPGDAIDLRAVRYSAGETVSAQGNVVTVTSGGVNYRLAITGAGTQGGFALSQAADGGTRLTTANAPVTVGTVLGKDGGNGHHFLGGLNVPCGVAAVRAFLGALGSHNGGVATTGAKVAALLHDLAGLRDDLAASLAGYGGTTAASAGAAPGGNGSSSALLPDAAALAALGYAGGIYASAGGMSPTATVIAGQASTSAGLG